LVGYSRFSATEYASAGYSFHKATDPPGTMRAEVILKSGEAPYYKPLDGPSNRWGDYSATVVDPLNDRDLWTIQEYAAKPVAGSDRWGTWWGRVDPDVLPSACNGRPAEALASISPTAFPRNVTGSLKENTSNAYAFEACQAGNFHF